MKRGLKINAAFLMALIFIWLSGFGANPTKIPSPVFHKSILHPAPYRPIHLSQNYGQLPLAFEPNQGQTDPQVQYLARGRGYNLFITGQEAVLVLKKPMAASSPNFPGKKGKAFSRLPKPSNVPPTVIHMRLEGTRSGSVFESQQKLPGVSNYFIGKDRSKWRRAVPQYGKVQTSDIYPGVDLVYYGNQGKLEYDFVVKPGADPQAIHLSYEGAKAARVNAQGDLELDTDQGMLHFRAPSVSQESQGLKNPVEGHYRLEEGGKLGFEVKDYDHSKPLVIDPVLDYSTYLGGTGQDGGNQIALDSAGDAYTTGYTASPDFPVVSPFQSTFGGNENAFVAEINPTGTAMLYVTYLGGTGYDSGVGIAVDSNANAYIVGTTNSLDFPTQNPIQAALSNPYSNVFVTEVSSGGGGLVYSTFLGGSGNAANNYGDFGDGIAVDSTGAAYIDGITTSVDFPTQNPIQANLTGFFNIYTAKISPNGTGLVFSTYLGGTAADAAAAIALDSSGDVYLTGYTYSPDFPVVNAVNLDPTFGGNENAFVTEINSSETALVYSTYLGGSNVDSGTGIAVDPLSNAYVTGFTDSLNFPLQNPYQSSLSNGTDNVFITEVAAGGTSFVYSTYMGGSGNGDDGMGIAVDNQGYASVVGYTYSSDFPTVNAIQSTESSVSSIPFILQMGVGGSGLMYSTFLGGTGGDRAFGVAVDNNGNSYVVGTTYSTDFPVTVTPPQTSLAGSSDVFISEISQPLPPTPTPTPTDTATSTPIATPTTTFTPTFTPTSTFTGTASVTPTKTVTSTVTSTATTTPTATPPIITVTVGDPYPNPISGPGAISIPVQAPAGSIAHWTVYTTGFRKVYDHKEPIPGNNGLLTWGLLDSWGTPVANGLYYIRVQVMGLSTSTQILKVLVLR